MNMRRNTNTDIGKIEVEETGLIDVVKCLMNLRKEVVPFILFVNRCCMGACTGISFVDGIQLITKLKSNMKGQFMTVSDKILLRKRALIETRATASKYLLPFAYGNAVKTSSLL